LVLVLSTTPCFWEDDCAKMENKSSSELRVEQQDKCCDNCCSPFVACKICLGFNLTTCTTLVYFSKNIIIKSVTGFRPIVTTKDFFNAIWHPPQWA